MGFLCERRIDGKDGTGGHRQQLEFGGALDKHCEDRRFLNRFAGRKLAMVGEKNGALVPERVGDYSSLFVSDRRPRPFTKPGTVFVEQRGIHV